MATIESYEIKGGKRYRVRYRTPDHRQTDKRGFRTKKEAEAFAATVEVSKLQGSYIDPKAGKVPLAEYAQQWLDGKHKLAPSTRSRYQSIIDNRLTDLGHHHLSAITDEHVAAWVADLTAEASPETVHKTVGVLRQVMDQAVARKRAHRNPCASVELPSIASDSEMRFLTAAELHRLALAAGQHKVLIYTLGLCGLRFGEAAAMRHRDVNRGKSRLIIRRSVTMVDGKMIEGETKSRQRREIPVPAMLLDLLPSVGEPDALVFPDSRGGYMRANNVRRRWFQRAVDDAGLPLDLHPHELRHTAASLAIQSGANIKVIQAMLGHKSAGLTLDRYGHLYPDDLDSVGAALDAVMTRLDAVG